MRAISLLTAHFLERSCTCFGRGRVLQTSGSQVQRPASWLYIQMHKEPTCQAKRKQLGCSTTGGIYGKRETNAFLTPCSEANFRWPLQRKKTSSSVSQLSEGLELPRFLPCCQLPLAAGLWPCVLLCSLALFPSNSSFLLVFSRPGLLLSASLVSFSFVLSASVDCL
jgi:hypothetical protein